MPRLLLVALGQLTGAVLEHLARRGSFDQIVVASRSPAKARAKINNARIGAALDGKYPNITAIELDFNRPNAARVLRATRPDVAFAAPSLLPWWALDRLAPTAKARIAGLPFAAFMACHLAPMLRLRDAWMESGLQCPWIGASYPDVVNHILALTGAAPTCGIGNLAEAVPKVRFVAAAGLGVAESELNIKLVAQHAFEYFVYGDGKATDRPPFMLEVRHGDRDVTDMVRASLFSAFPIPYDADFNRITAGAAGSVIEALAGENDVADHVPAPNGLLGGYPVTISRRGVRLDLPGQWTPAEAEAINRASLPWDGIADVERDGTVVFTDKTAQGLHGILGRSVERLRPADADTMADALITALRP
ncbi:MAG: hypothetical protein ACREEE_03200 [Dongiaceae bacterium]